MRVLIRNAARPNRPVMGIAMRASPVMRLTTRDMWIGWLTEAAEKNIADGGRSKKTFARSLGERTDASIADIRWDDLVTDEEIDAPGGRSGEQPSEVQSIMGKQYNSTAIKKKNTRIQSSTQEN